MLRKRRKNRTFYGTITIGEKGQAVIPMEARKSMGIGKSDKLLVFGVGRDTVAFTKLAKVEQYASRLSRRLKAIREIIQKSR